MNSESKRRVYIRPVALEDAAQLQANCFSASTVEQVREAIVNTLAATTAGKELQLVAEADGQVIGSATLIRDGHPLRSHRAGLFGLVVNPAYQKRGVARQLVDALLVHARSIGIEILETSCRAGTGAEAVYPKLGFTEYGRLPGGIYQTWGTPAVFDEVYFYRMCNNEELL
ncbi:MAG: GNAT family N-acetyltransferase [Caldilineaceae bacterium]